MIRESLSQFSRSDLTLRSVGDPIEVEFVELDSERVLSILGGRDEGSLVQTRSVWRPATITSVRPLTVAFADGSRLTVNSSTRVRTPDFALRRR